MENESEPALFITDRTVLLDKLEGIEAMLAELTTLSAWLRQALPE